MDEDIYKRLESFSVEELVSGHKALYELSESKEVSHYFYDKDDRFTTLSKILDIFELGLNRVLIDRLLEQKGSE